MSMMLRYAVRWRFSLTAAAFLLLGGGMLQQAWGAENAAQKPDKGALKIDLNTATAEQLQELPGIGASYAKKLIARRPYTSIKDLSKTGIPASTIVKIKPLVEVWRCRGNQSDEARPEDCKSAAQPKNAAHHRQGHHGVGADGG